MTRAYHQKLQCSNCGCWTTAETGFSRWIRERQDLKSEDGIVCCDIDYIVHKYKGRPQDGRSVQCLMFLEVKTRGSEPTKSQQDTLLLLDQFLNNQRQTPSKRRSKRQAAERPNKVFSVKAGMTITAKMFGGYLLQFEQTGPHDSKWIRWGARRREITSDQLAALLRFDLNPDTLAPLDLRSHHEQRELPLLNVV